MGVDLTKFTGDQLKAIELLALGSMNMVAICTELKIHRTTLYSWRRQSLFVEAVVSRSRELIRTELPEVYQALVGQAKAGNTPSIKLVLEHLEKLEEMKAEAAESSISFTWDTE